MCTCDRKPWKAKDGSHAAMVKTASAIPSKKLSSGLVNAINESRRDKEIKKRASSSPKTILPSAGSPLTLEPSAPLTTTTDTAFDTAMSETLDYGHNDYDDDFAR